jgi:hypothetical protein
VLKAFVQDEWDLVFSKSWWDKPQTNDLHLPVPTTVVVIHLAVTIFLYVLNCYWFVLILGKANGEIKRLKKKSA